MANNNRCMPEHAIAFPRSLDQANCGDLYQSDPEDIFSTRSSATKLMDQQSGHPTAHSLRWLHVLTRGQDPAPMRITSTASAPTYKSILQHPDDTTSFPDETAPGSESEVLPPDKHRGRPMLSQRVPSLSETRRVSPRRVIPPFSKKRSADLISVNSVASLPSSPTTPNTPFSSNPAIADFKDRPFPNVGSGPNSKVVRDHFPKGGNVNGSAWEEKLPSSSCFRKKYRDQCSEREQVVAFYPNADLSLHQLQHARNLDILDHEGKKVRFGDLWKDQPTCVIFIRHFRSCMDYLRSIKEQIEPDVIQRAGVRLVIISNSSPAMIRTYLHIFKFPFPLYTDPTCALYRAFGMTLRTTDEGTDSERRSYLRHSTDRSISMVVKNTFMKMMLLQKSAGDAKQLGGEFVLGPDLRCSFVSRMHNTRSHVPVKEVLSAAGVQVDLYSEAAPQMFYDNEEQWMKDRETELKRIQARKGLRRGFVGEYRDSESIDLDRDPIYVQPLPHQGSMVKELGYIKERPDDSYMQ